MLTDDTRAIVKAICLLAAVLQDIHLAEAGARYNQKLVRENADVYAAHILREYDLPDLEDENG